MTDQTAAGLSESEVRAQRAQIARELLAARQLRPATIWAITGAAAVVLLGHFCLYEGLPANILFTAATTAGIAAAFVLARLAFKYFGITIHPIFYQVFWIVVIAFVVILGIRFVLTL